MAKVQANQAAAPEIVVFSILRDSKCAECGQELGKGRFLRREDDRALCLGCADLDHLVFLPRGNAALTRRAGKYSELKVVVVRFSRGRGRYERQGVLVQEAALERAEADCLADADARAARREREEERRRQLDDRYVAEFALAIRSRYQSCPETECTAIAEHACRKYSGRIGRTAAAKNFDTATIDLAVRAHVRHVHTRYDALLASGRERTDAREAVSAAVESTLQSWSS